MKDALLPLVPALWLAAVQLLPWPFELRPPAWLERALYNPRERTGEGMEAYEAGRFEASAESMETALRLAGGAEPPEAGRPEADPRLLYNAGTARLAAGDERRAVGALERAATALAEADDPGAAPPVHYNLGSSRLEAGDPAGAVEAFKQALRLDPGSEDAKHNLEVALRRLEQQRKLPLRRPRETPGGDREGEREQGEQGGPQEPSDGERRDADAADPGEGDADGDRDRPADRPDERGGREGEARERPLPRFEDQHDMTAEQAAALLEAVENLERRQRQLEAAERARREAHGRKDW